MEKDGSTDDPLLVELEETDITLYGGSHFQLTASLQADKGRLHYLVGDNGSGKTLTLKALAYICSLPLDPIRSIQRVNTAKGLALAGIDPQFAKSAFVDQNPVNNFDASPIADNIRDFISRAKNSASSSDDIHDLLLNAFGFKGADLFKLPHQFSTGQQQILATALRLAIRPTLLFLDEPFSRLSRRWAQRLHAFSNEYGGDTFLLASSHPWDLLIQDTHGLQASLVQRIERHIHVGGEVTFQSLPRHELDESVTVGRFLDRETFDDACKTYDNLQDLPINHVIFLPAKGHQIPLLSRRLTIETKGNEVTHAHLRIAPGLNLLVGDTGSGKTLVGKALTGQLWYKGLWIEGLNKLLARGPLAYSYDFKLTSGKLKGIVDKKAVFFVPSEPRLLSEPTLEKEYALCGPRGRDLFDRVLNTYNLQKAEKPSSQSYGVQKMVQLALVPDVTSMVVLDEPFGSLSDEMCSIAASHILNRVEDGAWKFVVVTSNRPIETIMMLDYALSGVVKR